MQKYKEINGNDYVKNSRTTINETMQSIQSMNSGTAFPTTNLFEGMKCYRTDLKKTYTLTDVENNTWVEDAHATLSDEATHAAAADTATKVNATVPSDKVGELVKAKMGDNDAFRIAVGGSANNGWVELATADDGTESIYVRQYADAKTDGFVTPTRTATLLDGNGNTSFPGKVTAPNFIGSLNGNAATATKLQTPRTLSLTGKAAGSATFDGSSNASINVTSVNADTASKLSTARKINITGNATGAATFDGTSDVSINVSVSQATNATSATKLANNGDRNDLANGTKAMSGLSVYQCYQNTGYPQQYGNVVSIGGTGDNELFLGWADDSRLLYRAKRDNESNWKSWRAIAFTDEINDYAPTKTGSGASGTWGINISGNADNATKWNGIIDDHGTENNTATWIPVYVNDKIQHVDRTKMTVGNATNAGNADKVDGYHENSFLRYRGDAATTGEDTLWSQIGIKEYDGKLPKGVSGTYNYGSVVSLPGGGTRLDIWYNHQCSANGDGLWYRSGWESDQKPWARLLDSNNYTNWAPTKTGAGASGTWGISISGNAKTASSVAWDGVTGKPGTYPPSAHNHDSAYPSVTGTRASGTWGISISGNAKTASSVAWDGVTGKPGTYPPSAHNHDSAYPSVTGTRASGTWGISISGNAASATNADKLDGYHASDIINRISAANTGGIVAASLTENGYVKFANGLILQWGKVLNAGTHQISFPIAFLNGPLAFAGISIRDGEDTGSWRVRTYTTTNFTYYAANKDYGSYIVVGT